MRKAGTKDSKKTQKNTEENKHILMHRIRLITETVLQLNLSLHSSFECKKINKVTEDKINECVEKKKYGKFKIRQFQPSPKATPLVVTTPRGDHKNLLSKATEAF